MTIQYKNAGFSLDTTSVKTLFTCPTSGVAIIKSILIANDHSSDVAVKAALNDGTTYQFYQKTLTSDSSDDAVSGVLNLEAGDAVTAEANVSNVVTGVINYALIDRSQENG
jgi:hypothetical protein